MLLTKIILARTYLSKDEKIISSASSNTDPAPSLITRIINKVTDILEKVIDMLQHLWHILPPIAVKIIIIATIIIVLFLIQRAVIKHLKKL